MCRLLWWRVVNRRVVVRRLMRITVRRILCLLLIRLTCRRLKCMLVLFMVRRARSSPIRLLVILGTAILMRLRVL